MTEQICFGAGRITIENIVALAQGKFEPKLNTAPEFEQKISQGVRFLERLLDEDGVIYGVTTGYGDSCVVEVPLSLVHELPIHLSRFHGCGMGADLSLEQSRAVIATRLASLTQGYSGVSMELLELLVALLVENLPPRIPSEGSVGASGDLTPLSYLAAVLIGEREVWHGGRWQPTQQAFSDKGLKPLTLRPKEALAIMNGTAVMTGLAALAYSRADYLSKLCSRITAMACIGLQGNAFHFDEKLFEAKPHPGQQQIAKRIREDIHTEELPRNSSRLQDRYSIRCAPHVIGVLEDSLPWFRSMIENEINSANDNPLIDGPGEHVMHGGHFYGGHIAMAMDSMKTAVANLADLLDRQMALLMDTRYNNGLPSNLSGSEPARAMINHGMKAVQIGASAWTAEALKGTMPASVFSRSTECHNQDKVSMGTISTRDCLRVLELTEQVAAAQLLAVRQAFELRINQGELDESQLTVEVRDFYHQLRVQHELITEDRPLEYELKQLAEQIEQQHWELY
ncbi:histidine ammonia-lyase [Sinobacterium caligoides]|uniref:Histidine ammonia-lyase n=1 Tax=Sinobacterium caligoides TaxID=933926 RepID=A0A3N2DP48_9GAMM|nr:aromatic amino acid ammonia-lyase [Sinobacterium caligoides]ROS01584.1 histidine ammonia-lyase [Sinobacterium caligoides]